MGQFLPWALALGALLAAAPLVAMLGRRYGRAARGGVVFVGLLLGLGEVIDPPSKHRSEVGLRSRKDRAAPGDPPTPD